jgi:primosomal protein N' (replication factor Y)
MQWLVMSNNNGFLRLAIPSPLRGEFDYLPCPDEDVENLKPGIRVLVPFGHRQVVGILLSVVNTTDVAPQKLKTAVRSLDSEPVITPEIMKICRWAAAYYQHPLGDVLAHVMPGILRNPNKAPVPPVYLLTVTQEGLDTDLSSMNRTPRQREILSQLIEVSHPAPVETLRNLGIKGPSLKALVARGLVAWNQVERQPAAWADKPFDLVSDSPHSLTAEQIAAVDAIAAGLDSHTCYLLDGITGSGKTEVYLRVIESVLKQGRQALVLVPEIGLTPQTLSRFRRRFNVPLVVLHSSLNDQERLSAWVSARDGDAAIVIGTRSAVFTPLRNPGVIVVDEEHDASYKQQEGFRYSARDLSVMRGREEGVSVILGSATPSLETIHNVNRNRYHELRLTQRSGSASTPVFNLLDIKNRQLDCGFSDPLIKMVQNHLDQGNQVLVFLNRRGFAPTLICHHCGWIANCRRCDARLTVHKGSDSLRCHHCNAYSAIPEQCPACHSSQLIPLGVGTERTESALNRLFPGHRVIRIDRDTTRRRSAMSNIIEEVDSGTPCILVGTQMLAKGHHFPDVTLVAIMDVDAGLFSADFRAIERMGQLILQVSGRSGRAEKPGQVAIQTHYADHPLLTTIIKSGYRAFAEQTIKERRETRLPPFSFMAVIRAQSTDRARPSEFLQQVKHIANSLIPRGHQVETFGPIPSIMERKAGKFRAQLLFQSSSRGQLGRLLTELIGRIDKLNLGTRVRWSVDVDPLDIF